MKIKFIIFGLFVLSFILFFSFVITDYVNSERHSPSEIVKEEIKKPLTYLQQKQEDQVSEWKEKVREKIKEYEK